MYRTQRCLNCGADREHSLEGENPVGRPVWRCTECDETTVGPFADRGELTVADGGES